MKFNSEAERVTTVTISTPAPSRTVAYIAGFAELTRILLVDDEIELWWEECLAALARSGYHVDTAEDGEAAWEALQSNDYDLLITDNKMPKLWGLELISAARTQGMALPIIFASSLLPTIPPEQKPYFVNVHLMEKPVTPSQLSQTLRHIARTQPRVSPTICSCTQLIHSCSTHAA